MKTKPTHTPWTLKMIPALRMMSRVNAAFVLKAVNAYDQDKATIQALVEFAEKVSRSACLDQRLGEKCICFSCEAKAALAQAQGKGE